MTVATEPLAAPGQPADPSATRTFSQVLGAIEDGVFHQEATEKLRDLIAQLHDVARDQGGKPSGSLSMDFKLTLDSGVVEVVADLKVKTPKSQRGKTIFWATPENHLTKRNPRQTELFRDVTPGAGAARTAV